MKVPILKAPMVLSSVDAPGLAISSAAGKTRVAVDGEGKAHVGCGERRRHRQRALNRAGREGLIADSVWQPSERDDDASDAPPGPAVPVVGCGVCMGDYQCFLSQRATPMWIAVLAMRERLSSEMLHRGIEVGRIARTNAAF